MASTALTTKCVTKKSFSEQSNKNWVYGINSSHYKMCYKTSCSEQSNKNWVYGINSSHYKMCYKKKVVQNRVTKTEFMASTALTTKRVTKNAPVLKLYKINVWPFKILTPDGGHFSFPPAYEVVAELTPHVIPRTDIACCPQNFHRMWSPEITSRVFPRIAILMWSP